MRKKILICHVIVGLQVGGAELMLRRLVENGISIGNYRHKVISLTNVGVVGLQLRNVGVDVYEMNMKSILDLPLVTFRLALLFAKLQPSIVQTWMYHADLIGGIAARFSGIDNVIWGIHTVSLAGGGAKSTVWVRKLCSILSKFVPKIIVCAAESSKKIHVALGYSEKRMVVIQNGFETNQANTSVLKSYLMRYECGFNSDAYVIGCVGRFNHDKDQLNFVRAAGILSKRHIGVKYLMVGRNCDPSNNQLLDWIREVGLTHDFVLLGERNDVSLCLMSMNAFCLSSRSEAFPLVVGEAMNMGLPCIVTNVGDVALLVSDTGVIVDKENHFALASGLEQVLMMSHSERFEMGRRARDRICGNYSMSRVGARFESLYSNLLSGTCS